MIEETKIRVVVLNGDGSKILGLGTKIGRDTVYAFSMPSGSLITSSNPTVEPSEDEKKEYAEKGAKFVTIKDNPVIQMDDGRVLYGCQTWWRQVDPNEEYMLVRELQSRRKGG